MDHLASCRSDDGRADDDSFFIGNQFYESIAEVTGVAAGHDVERCDCFVYPQVALDTVVFGEADSSNLREGKRDARADSVVRRGFLLV